MGGELVVGSDNISTVFSGSIYDSGSASVTKTGTGTLTLSGANFFSGGTTINDGTLAINSGDNLGSGTITFAGGTLKATGADGYTVANNFQLSGGDGTLRNDLASGALTLTGGIALGGQVITFTGAGVTHIGGPISQPADVVVDAGHVTYDTQMSYAGPTFLRNGGTLTTTVDDAMPTGMPTGTRTDLILDDIGSGGSTFALGGNSNAVASLTGASISRVDLGSGGMLTIGSDSSTPTTFAGVISGEGGSLVKDGASTQILSGPNTYSGGTTINTGTLQIGDGATAGSIAGDITNNAALAFSRSDAVTYGGVISGSGSVTKLGTGTLTLSGANTYDGGTTISAGTLAVVSNRALGTSTLTLNGGALQSSYAAHSLSNPVSLNADFTISGSLPLTLDGAFTLNGFKSLTVTNTALTTISGAIGESSTSIFIKQGGGELLLSGANTYTGGTLIGSGTVRIENTSGSAFGIGAVTVAFGATLTGAGSFSGALQNNGTTSLGNSPILATLSSFAQGSSGTLIMELGGTARGSQYDALDIAGSFLPGGTLTISLISSFNPQTGESFDLFHFGSLSGTFAILDLPALSGLSWNTSALYTTGILGVTAIPEPSTYAALFGLAALGFAAYRRRHSNR